MAHFRLAHRSAMTRVYFHTFGCKANQYDTEVLRQALAAVGAVAVRDPAQADAAVVNSCAVTHVSEAKMRRLVRRIGRRNAATRTVVMGCAAALDDGTIAALPGVTAVVGGADVRQVLEALGFRANGIDPVLRSFERGARAWLKIQDGCDEHCTFCATTLARGVNRSRSPDEIVEEARALADGHEEIVLTGVHIGTYGADRDGVPSLGSLVERLVVQVPAVRFRLSSVEATEVDDRLADLMIGAPDRLAPHLHAPLQSGSNRVLKRMGRHWYTVQTYRARIEWLASRLPQLGLGADVIVGFPGESEEDFLATRSVVEALPFTYLHVFPYSERSHAPATKLGPPVAPELNRRRSAALRGLAQAKALAFRESRHLGKADVVLLRRNGGRYEGMTQDYLSVYVGTQRVPPGRFNAVLRLEDGTLWADPTLD